MSSFVPGYEHDIFVSYAHVDDLALPGAESGWVATLIAGLKVRLSQKLGRADLFSLWKDEHLSAYKPFSPEILTALTGAATLVIILSPGYKASRWCLTEMETFWQEMAQRTRSDSRIFVVERDRLEIVEKPRALEELLGYQFWVQDRPGKAPRILGDPIPDPRDKLYYDKLGDLANDLAEELKKLKAAAEQAASRQPLAQEAAVDNRPVVFLAEATDDLDIQRDRVSRHLDQEGFRVIPAGTSHYFSYLGGNDKMEENLAGDLKNCKLFVQLLSGLTGKCRPGQPCFPLLQHRTAERLAIPVLQWRSPDLKTATIEVPEHRALLEGDTVMAMGLEEFKQECVTRLRAPPPKPKPVINTNLVFLNASSDDSALVETIGSELSKYEIGYAVPPRSCDPKILQEDLELTLSECDGLIIVYGPTTYAWARAQILRSRRIIGLRDRPLKAMAVYEGPPADKEPLGVAMPGMLTLDGRRKLSAASLLPFVTALQMD